MKILANLGLVKRNDVNLPFQQTIQDETETQLGTPIVADLMQDIFSNLYRLLEITKITPTNAFDTDLTQYQLIEALKKLPNSLNDVEQTLTLNVLEWNVGFDLTILPNKYFFFARASDNYNSSSVYTFKGSDGTLVYDFVSSGFLASDELLVVIDSGTVRAYSLNLFTTNTDVLLSFGNPLSYNDTNKMMYEDNGSIYSDLPSSNQLQAVLRVDKGSSDLLVNDIFLIKGFVLCFCYVPADNEYFFYQFDENDLNTVQSIVISTSLNLGTDRVPYVYTDGNYLYITNDGNTSVNDYTIKKFQYVPQDQEINFVSSFSIDNTFVKTSNACIKGNFLYTMISGSLSSFNLLTGVKTLLGLYDTTIGRIFNFNGEIYFTSGEIAKKWSL